MTSEEEQPRLTSFLLHCPRHHQPSHSYVPFTLTQFVSRMVLAHAFNPNTQETETGGAWSTEQVQGS